MLLSAPTTINKGLDKVKMPAHMGGTTLLSAYSETHEGRRAGIAHLELKAACDVGSRRLLRRNPFLDIILTGN